MWCAIRKSDGVVMKWLAAHDEETAWNRLLAALAGCLPCTVEDAMQRGYDVRFFEELK